MLPFLLPPSATWCSWSEQGTAFTRLSVTVEAIVVVPCIRGKVIIILNCILIIVFQLFAGKMPIQCQKFQEIVCQQLRSSRLSIGRFVGKWSPWTG